VTTTPDRFVVEHFDGLVSDDPRVRAHLAFVRTHDAYAASLPDSRRSYVIPAHCSACALIVKASEGQR
jgi:hypothetical protein